jgi:protein-S-isoprenylcysteine O-methyltransferase Ste14
MSGQVSRELAVRAGVLYVPVLAALFAGVLLPRRKRMFAACLLSVLWVLPALVVLQRLNAAAGWWSFAAGGPAMRGMPLEVWFGCAVLWGSVPQLAMPTAKLRWCVLAMVLLDVATMPLCAPLVALGPRWLVGEAVAVAVVLVPALCVARWTLEGTHLAWRGAMQVATAGLVFLYLVPEIAFALKPGAGWAPLLALRGWRGQLAGLGVFALALPGLAAVQEFAARGLGTPIPYDPPQRLVVSGIYRYCANPMQLGCALVMLAWAGLLRNAWLVVPAVISVVYSAGIAEWDERRDLEERFGAAYLAYRSEAPNWRLRALPYVGGATPDKATARIYISATCGPCSEFRRWLERRQPVGLEMVDAETPQQNTGVSPLRPFDSPSLCSVSLRASGRDDSVKLPIRRVRYVASDGTTEQGVKALGRALEHLHVGWALAGAAARLPVVSVAAQALTDASGFGPRELDPVKTASHKVHRRNFLAEM